MKLAYEIARIEQAQRDVRAYVADVHKCAARENVTVRNFAVAGMVVGTGLFAAGAAFAKLIG